MFQLKCLLQPKVGGLVLPVQRHMGLTCWKSADSLAACNAVQKRGNCRSISGAMFWKKRPLEIPHLRAHNWRSKWLEGKPQKKGVCVRVFVRTPKKPNSGLRKCARVRLSTRKTVLAYIPGIGHSLRTHSIVLLRGGRIRDLPGCNLKVIRGKHDALPVKNRWSCRSKYGVKRPAFCIYPRWKKWYTLKSDYEKYLIPPGKRMRMHNAHSRPVRRYRPRRHHTWSKKKNRTVKPPAV
eukprot:Platyproteum_vivax@DN4098_c0_g1_i1.p1